MWCRENKNGSWGMCLLSSQRSSATVQQQESQKNFIKKLRKPNEVTKIYNGEKLKDQNKSNFSQGTKPILIK